MKRGSKGAKGRRRGPGSIGSFLFSFALLFLLVPDVAAAGPLEPPSENAEPAPRLVVDDSVHDWGTVYKGELVEHSFRLTNKGSAPLLIKEVKSTCGCSVTRGPVKDKILKPGESTTVTVRLDTAELKPGLTKKHTDVHTHVATQDTKLWMQGNIKELLKVTPEKLRLEVVRDEEAAPAISMKIFLHSELGRRVDVEELQPANQLVRVDFSPVEPGRRYQAVLRPRLDINHKLRLHKEVLKAAVAVSGKRVSLSIPLKVVLMDRVDVAPSKSVWFPREATKRLKSSNTSLPVKTLLIQSIAGPSHRFRITSVKVRGGAFKARYETVKKGRSYKLFVELQPPREAKRLIKDTIVVETDDPKVPEIAIPSTALF